MTTTIRINLNLHEIAAERGHVDDVHALVAEAVAEIAHRLEQGDTAGDVRTPYYDRDIDAWDSFGAATFDVVDDDGMPVIDLAGVV